MSDQAVDMGCKHGVGVVCKCCWPEPPIRNPNPNDPAYPNGPIHMMNMEGLTKREYFAAMAMGAAMQYASGDGKYLMEAKDFAQSAIAYADALIAELNKKTGA